MEGKVDRGRLGQDGRRRRSRRSAQTVGRVKLLDQLPVLLGQLGVGLRKHVVERGVGGVVDQVGGLWGVGGHERA